MTNRNGKRRSAPRRWRLLIAMTAITTLAASAAWANSSDFGSSGTTGSSSNPLAYNGTWLTNNYYMTVWKRNLTSYYENGLDDAIDDEYQGTDLYIAVYDSDDPCETSTYPPDLCVYDANYGANNYYAWNACAGVGSGSNGDVWGTHPNQYCYPQKIRFNKDHKTTPCAGGSPAAPSAKALACHEFGHSVGLQHVTDTTSCLASQCDTGVAMDDDLRTHEINHINAQY